MKLPPELKEQIKAYRRQTPWYKQWPLYRQTMFAAIPLFIIMLAIYLGISVADVIADLCTSGKMPPRFRWLC